MRVIAVDDEPLALRNLEAQLRKIPDVTTVTAFTNSAQAAGWLDCHEADVAFLDIQMSEMDGLELAKWLRERQPRCPVVFVTGYAEYAVQAFSLHASGYIIKPASLESLKEELYYIQNPITPPPVQLKHLQIRCFGNFEVFVDGEPLKFERSKTKELLAYLVDRKGAAVNTGELCGVLWEDKPDSRAQRNHLRILLSDLSRTLKREGIEGILIKSRNHFAIAVDKFSCDYYDFLNKNVQAVNQYCGEYMTQYTWAEMTLGFLEYQSK